MNESIKKLNFLTSYSLLFFVLTISVVLFKFFDVYIFQLTRSFHGIFFSFFKNFIDPISDILDPLNIIIICLIILFANLNINSILKNLDHVLIKIDIEGNEYQTLADIKKNANKILCLVIEFHKINENIQIIENFINEIEILKLIHIHANNFAGTNDKGDPNSLELTFVNNNKLELDLIKTIKTFPINSIDYPNWKRQKDINLKFDE